MFKIMVQVSTDVGKKCNYLDKQLSISVITNVYNKKVLYDNDDLWH